MTHCPSLPAEIWQTVLENAIHVPIFLETHPITTETALDYAQMLDTGRYWESERVRNALRRVCSSWNVFLKTFDHRYIQTDDVIHGFIPAQALRRAIRLRFVDCACDQSTKKKSCIRGRKIFVYPEDHVLDTIDNDIALPWRLEILESLLSSPLTSKIFSKPHRSSNLKSVLGEPRPILLPLLDCGVRLQVLWTTKYQVFSIYSASETSFTAVTTLRFIMKPGSDIVLPDLPALRHLYFTASPAYNLHRILTWLENLGKQLHVLDWSSAPEDRVPITLHPTIWELCPLVQVLSLPPEIVWSSPPENHPIHTLRIIPLLTRNRSARCNNCDSIHEVNTNLGAPIAEYAASGIRKIAISNWEDAVLGIPSRNTRLQDDKECVAVQASGHGIRFWTGGWRQLHSVRSGRKPTLFWRIHDGRIGLISSM